MTVTALYIVMLFVDCNTKHKFLEIPFGQTGPQPKINIENTRAAGASEREIVEVIWQMAVYGGMPAAINGLNAAKEVFGREAT